MRKTNNTQQKHSYHEFIENFSFLFKEIKEKDENLLSNEIRKGDESIYNAVVGFNTVKFLTEHADWNWNEDENKNKAYEVILPEWNKIKKAEQKVESEVKVRLKEYVEDVAGVSIYGNHASITLEDNKKEFKTSEFLNSDFCQKNRISGFSTLHSDGKSGMHGFVAEGGRKKIRNYVVTGGSYEMTLKWYAEGKECEIKIKIDANGVDLVKGNDFSLERLEANRDVKIGGLFLHEIKFREKGKVDEVQHEGKDNQVLNKSSEIAIKSNSRDIEQEVKKPVQKHQATHMNRNWSQTPSLPPLRTSSLPPKENVVNEQGRNASAKPVSQDGGQRHKQNNPTPNNQQQPEIPQQEGNSEQKPKGGKLNYKKGESSSEPQANRKSELSSNTTDVAQKRFLEDFLEKIKADKPIYKWLKGKIEGKEDNQNLDALEGKLSRKYSQGNIIEKRENDDGKPLSLVSTERNEEGLIYVEQRDNTLVTEFTSKLDKETQKFPLKPVDQEEQTKEHLLATGLLKENAAETKINDSGYSSPTYTSHYNFQVSSEQLRKRLETIGSKKEEDTLEKLNKGLKEPSQQATKTKDLFLDSMLEKIKEGKQYDPVRKFLERKVAEQENDNTNLTIEKNSELYKLLEKDAAQLKVGVIEEERKDTLTEHTDSYDRNRIALGNRNKRPLGWAKRIAEPQEKDTNKSF